jgi:hypothetical protein
MSKINKKLLAKLWLRTPLIPYVLGFDLDATVPITIMIQEIAAFLASSA